MEYYWEPFITNSRNTKKLINKTTRKHVIRLSSDAISSAYDDRLDKKESGVPGDLKSPTPGPGRNVETSRNR